MGFFSKLFEKKICDICGNEIKLLANRKLEDGNMCKSCVQKLSPWFDERRHSTVEQINNQLEYREANKDKVQAFHTTRVFGERTKLFLDENARVFMITLAHNVEEWREDNPDVVSFSQVIGCIFDIDESYDEIKRRDSEGKEVSYNPPRYRYDYNFYITVQVNHPYFDDMKFKLNNNTVEIETQFVQRGKILNYMSNKALEGNAEYCKYKTMGEEIRDILLQKNQQVQDAAAEDIEVAEITNETVMMTCPYCDAKTTPDEAGCCEYCGGVINN